VLIHRGHKPEDRDGGFSMIEVMITALVLSIVAAIAASALLSLTNEASRNVTVVRQEQTASTVMAQLASDIRSAVSLTFLANASPSTQIELGEPNSTVVLWVYSGTTLTRCLPGSQQATVPPPCPQGWTQAGFQATNVANASSQPVFTYYDATGTSTPNGVAAPIPAGDQSTVEANATAISVNLYLSSTRSGVPTYNSTEEVALTNLLNANQPAGQGT
jgi:prepilin-type N-terminal cleavage/methylation domain-containing protein